MSEFRSRCWLWPVVSALLVLRGLAEQACAATYYVDKDSIGGIASDTNSGSITQPWRTLTKANSTLTAGDTVYIRAGTYTNDNIAPANSGTSDTNRITYSAYNGETVTLQGLVYAVRLNNVSYITVTRVRIYNCERNLYISASHHNDVSFCEIDTPMGPTTWAGSRVYSGSTSNRIHNCIFSRYGKEDYYDGSYQDFGCNLDIGSDSAVDRSDYNLVVSNTFFYGGHHILGVYANYNVVRQNTFHNEEWYPSHRTEIGGYSGDRNVILNTSYPEYNIRNVIEDNAIVFSGVPPDQVSSSGMSVRTKYNIIRRNIFYYNDSAGLALTVDGGNYNDASGNHVYNNVFYKNGYPLLDTWHVSKSGMLLARWVNDTNHNQMVNVAIKNNILYENQLYGIYYYYVNKAEQVVENNWEEAGDPGFVDTTGAADPFDFTVFDFHLSPTSRCVDAGAFLTQAVNAGTNSVTLRVGDAGYFTDGMGVIDGDMIQMAGKTNTARVVGIDYGSNTVMLGSPLSWSVGTGVSLPYRGSAPDQGACEYDGFADVDGDLMPDIWESANLPGGHGEPGADADNDGLSNLEEYRAGTIATNAQSLFALGIGCPSGQVVISMTPVVAEGAGYLGKSRFYRLGESVDLRAGTWTGIPGCTNIPAAVSAITYTSTNSSPSRFFRGWVWLE